MSTEENQENLEISIFKDIDASKTIVAAVMDPSVRRGVGPMLFRLLPALDTAMSTMTYTGDLRKTVVEDVGGFNPNDFGIRDYSEIFANDVEFTMTNTFLVFGGAAYHLHKTNDNSPFSHILPGVHDVDVALHSIVSGEGVDDAQNVYEHPFSRSCIDRLKNGVSSNGGENVSVLNQPDNILSSILDRMVTTIRHHIASETQAPSGIDRDYDLYINERTHKVQLKFPCTPGIEDPDLLYSEVVSNFYRIRVADEDDMLKVQVEIRARDIDANSSAMDHVFEVIMKVSDTNEDTPSRFVNIGGINVHDKEWLFNSNMASLLNRSAAATKLGLDDTDGILSAGKCAQDFLRVVYLLLDGLNTPEPRWVETKSYTRIFGVLPGKLGGEKNMKEMVKRLGVLATPIEVFMFITRYIEPCITKSNISMIDVFKDVDSETRTSTIDRDFRDIVDTFQNSFSHSPELLAHKEDIKRRIAEIREKDLEAAKIERDRNLSRSILQQSKTRMEHYLARDFEINVLLGIGEGYEADTRVVCKNGELSLSADGYNRGKKVSVSGHNIVNENTYRFQLSNGEYAIFFIDDFVKALSRK